MLLPPPLHPYQTFFPTEYIRGKYKRGAGEGKGLLRKKERKKKIKGKYTNKYICEHSVHSYKNNIFKYFFMYNKKRDP